MDIPGTLDRYGSDETAYILVSHRYDYGFGMGGSNPDTDKACFGWRSLTIIFDIKA